MTDLVTGDTIQECDVLLFSEICMADDKIIGRSGPHFFRVDLESEDSIFLTAIPDIFYNTDKYPVIISDDILLPTFPPLCLSASSFEEVWGFCDAEIGQGLYVFDVAGDSHLSFFIISDGETTRLLAVRTSTGQFEWVSESLPLSLWLAVGEHTIFCGGQSLWAYTEEGEQKWEFAPEERITSNLVFDSTAVFFTDSLGNLYKVSVDGTVVWKTTCEVSPWYYETHLVGAGGVLFCTANLGGPDHVTTSKISAFSIKTGEKLWERELGASHYVKAPPLLADGILVVGTAGGTIVAIASDPDLFVEQGDTFIITGDRNRASESYAKALELCEKKEMTDEYQQILGHVVEKGVTQFGMPASTPPQTESPEPTVPETTSPGTVTPSLPERSPLVSDQYYIVVGVGILIVLVGYILRKRMSQ